MRISLDIDEELMRQLDKQEQLNHILDRATRVKILPAEMELKEIALLFDVFANNAEAFQNYLPSPLEAGASAVLFRSVEGKNETLDSPSLGWDHFLPDQLEVRNISGNHYSIMSGSNVRELAEQLRTYLGSFET